MMTSLIKNILVVISQVEIKWSATTDVEPKIIILLPAEWKDLM